MQLEQKIFSYLSKLQATFTAATTGIITSNGHGLQNEDKIWVSSSTTLPAGLSASTDYYVRDVTTNTFKVSTQPGGPAVAIADTGTGTHTFALKGKVIMTEGFEHLKLSLDTANSANLTIKFQGSDQEEAPNFNAAQSATNRWDYIDVIDMEDGSSIDGDTGIAPAGSDDHRQFAINLDALRWVTAVITSFTAGTVEVQVKSNKCYN